MVFQAEDRARAKRQQANLAIQLALQGRWPEALQLNRAIIDSFPTDVDAFNRLGKAFTELGRYADAREAYMKALEIDSLNSIARKNLSRLATLGEEAPPKAASQKLSPQMFIEETGKTGITTLMRPNMGVAARMTAGDQVVLQRNNGSLAIQTTGGEHIGEVEPKLGHRLMKLMDGGNEYVAAISTLDQAQVRVFIREKFQHASQTGKLSFPPTVTESFRPYIKERLVRQDADDEPYGEEGEEGEEWEPAAESEESDVTIYDLVPGAGGRNNVDVDVEEEEE
jgi:hypothetical protein